MSRKPPGLPAIEWDDLRYFLTLAREKSLSGAARSLGTTQPTMSRRLELFEKKLGAVLFQRRPSGLELTDTGRQILDYADRMEDAALAAERIATGSSAGLSGTIRVTSAEWLGARVLSPLLAEFCTLHPEMNIELVTDTEALSLTRRETDIAVRFGRFEQEGLMQRKIGSLPFGLYAAPGYLKAKGLPDFRQGGAGATVIAMNAALAESVAETKWLRHHLAHAHIAFRSNSRDGQAAAAVAGAGLVCLPARLAGAYPQLRAIETPAPVPSRDVWLGFHRDTRGIPRVRGVVDFLAERTRRLR
ncbi:LysR family transcriptional regulator [Bradyrhizobium zhanjiangense]|uniref:LysR family transcriptional regulator n=1 Tax=Bradyrhizobium zhanjiangense TaxID=1325107 RepID=UPI0019D6EEAA|nr:LysR family transcriptional regulator [Bradyrhizobium zhanjiangense]